MERGFDCISTVDKYIVALGFFLCFFLGIPITVHTYL